MTSLPGWARASVLLLALAAAAPPALAATTQLTLQVAGTKLGPTGRAFVAADRAAGNDLTLTIPGTTAVKITADSGDVYTLTGAGTYTCTKAACAALYAAPAGTARITATLADGTITEVLAITLEALPTGTAGAAGGGDTLDDDPLPGSGALVQFHLDATGRAHGACVRAASTKDCDPASTTVPPTLRPNTPIYVCVEAPPAVDYSVKVTGDRGSYVPTFANAYEGVGITESGAGAVPTVRHCYGPFASRKPGDVDVQVSMDKGVTFATVAELEVSPAYSGAVRIGVGLSTVADHQYEVQTVGGAGQSEIGLRAGGTGQAEFVVGATAFFDKGGRVYEADRTFTEHLGLYMGLGILDTGAEGEISLSVLSSVYLGAEYELSPTAAIAIGPALRRVERLADGYQVGGPIDGTTVPTTQKYRLGAAVVLTLTPDVLRIVRPNWAK